MNKPDLKEAGVSTNNAPLAVVTSKAPSWSVSIITARENLDVLSETIEAVLVAVRDRDCVVDVVVNGNPRLAEEAVPYVQSIARLGSGTTIRVWSIALGDKSHSINECIHRFWPESQIAFFVDGYAKVVPTAMVAIAEGLRKAPRAMAATSVPSVGRTAAAARRGLLAEGGITGALYAVRGSAMEEIRRRGFRLPIGMYRTDPTLGAALCFALDPTVHPWDYGRIVVCPEATFTIRPKSPFRLRDIQTHFNRLVNVMWGDFINQAVRNHLAIKRRRPEDLPGTAVDLVLGWVKESPVRALLLAVRRPLAFLALRRARRRQDLSSKDVLPKLLIEVRK